MPETSHSDTAADTAAEAGISVPGYGLGTFTETGAILPMEQESIEIYGYESSINRRQMTRVAAGDGEVHVDYYPSEMPGDSNNTAAHKANIVFVGGLSAHALQYASFQERLSRRGYNVYALDLRGHGRSSGERGDFTMDMVLEDQQAVVDLARRHTPGPVILFGTSLGGYYVLAGSNLMTDIDAVIHHWIMLPDMPVTKADRRMRPIAKLMGRVAPSMHKDTRTVANWDAVCDDPRLIEHLYNDPLMVFRYTMRALLSGVTYSPETPLTQLHCPHLIIQGERDEMTPLSYTRQVIDRLEGDVQLHIVPNAGHMGGLVEFQDEVLAVTDAWAAGHVPSPA